MTTTSVEKDNAVDSSTCKKSAIWDIALRQSNLKLLLYYDLWRYNQMYTHKVNEK